MKMTTISISRIENQCTIVLPETFNFIIRNEIMKVSESYPVGTHFCLDFQKVKHMDSSALGMLLIFRERAGGVKACVTLVNVNSHIRNLLHNVQFQLLFNIS